jgi:hypothetical protein
MSNGPKFTPAQREANLLTVSDLYLTGKTQAHIAGVIGCSQQQVSGYLKKLYKRWQADASANIDRLKARELARLDKVEAEAWAAWERSQEDAETVTTNTGAQSGTTTKVEGQVGDPRFLERVGWCITQRCKIIGVEAPTKIAPTDPTGNKAYESLTDAERAARIAAVLDRARARRDEQAAGVVDASGLGAATPEGM